MRARTRLRRTRCVGRTGTGGPADRIRFAALLAAGALTLSACSTGSVGGVPDPASGSGENGCPRLPEPTGPPERVVTMDGGSAAILRELGVADSVVGTAAPDFFTAFPEEDRAELERVPVIDEGVGNREAVIAAEPDLVMGVSPYQFGAFDGTPTPQELTEAGIAGLTACDTPGATTDLADTFAFVERAAEVFGVPERGAELVDRMREDVDAAAALAADADRPVRVLAVSVVPGAGQGVSTLGATGTANGVITLAGGENVAGDVEQVVTDLSEEQVVSRDPEAVLVLTGFSDLPEEELVEALLGSPAVAGSTAVREERFVVMPQSVVTSPSVLNAEAVRTLAETLHGEGDARW
ncbi:ABC transporter substrate-binding protein [Nocardiopsis sp. EMB25]|uniref:ABC transporter substrate-binding protein n=1 Tax=Nocardiopsis sp. EMB25 TaxID=2835867 RepID=UPI0022851775|nr:ABC transporter substrate-binding protein [Nocardiopsis sp. EMB25]MCY9785725.1 ABC transporter substrate-binding protein [Nocardiopsis sp. EMB25]